jgi:hypothetical protein
MTTEFLTRLRFLIFRKKPDELDDELRFHMEQLIASKVAAGPSDSEARRQPLIEFGGIESTREQCIQQRPRFPTDRMRYCLHMVRESPASSARPRANAK